MEIGHASIDAAAEYLDEGAIAWTRERFCIACHAMGVYMAERSGLTGLFGRPKDEVRADFASQVPKGDSVERIRNAEGFSFGSICLMGEASILTLFSSPYACGRYTEATFFSQ